MDNPRKAMAGIFYKRAEYELDRFIFVGRQPMPEEVWTKLCQQYGEHQNRVPAGCALLVDLCGDEPTFASVPVDYELPDAPSLN
jgi:hypothetical protein